MNEIDIIRHAKKYMDSLASGVNPITGDMYDENSDIRNERLAKCFDYVSGVLENVIRYGIKVPREKLANRVPFFLSDEQKKLVEISQFSIGLSDLTRNINAVIDPDAMRRVSAASLSKAMLRLGYLKETEFNGKTIKEVSQSGISAGIMTVDATSQNGMPYRKNIYNSEMQRYIINHINSLINDDPSIDTEEFKKAADALNDLYNENR